MRRIGSFPHGPIPSRAPGRGGPHGRHATGSPCWTRGGGRAARGLGRRHAGRGGHLGLRLRLADLEPGLRARRAAAGHAARLPPLVLHALDPPPGQRGASRPRAGARLRGGRGVPGRGAAPATRGRGGGAARPARARAGLLGLHGARRAGRDRDGPRGRHRLRDEPRPRRNTRAGCRSTCRRASSPRPWAGAAPTTSTSSAPWRRWPRWASGTRIWSGSPGWSARTAPPDPGSPPARPPGHAGAARWPRAFPSGGRAHYPRPSPDARRTVRGRPAGGAS